MTPAPVDVRLDALRAWLASAPNVPFHGAFDLAPASADASFRRYFRISAGGKTWIAMDAPPPQEDCRPFVKIAQLLYEAGLHAPRVIEIGRAHV